MSDTNSNLSNNGNVFKSNTPLLKYLLFGEEYKHKKVTHWDEEIEKKKVCIVLLKDLIISHVKPFTSAEASIMAVFHAFSSHLSTTHGCLKIFPGTYAVSFHHETDESMKITENFIEQFKGNSVENIIIEPQNIDFIPFPSIKTVCDTFKNMREFGYDFYGIRHKFYYDSHVQRSLHLKVANFRTEELERNDDCSTEWIVATKDQLSKFRTLEDAHCYISEIFRPNYCYLYSVVFDDGIIVVKNIDEPCRYSETLRDDKFQKFKSEVCDDEEDDEEDDEDAGEEDALLGNFHSNNDDHDIEDEEEKEQEDELLGNLHSLDEEDDEEEEEEDDEEDEEEDDEEDEEEDDEEDEDEEILGNLRSLGDEEYIDIILEPLISEMEEKIRNREYEKAISMYEQTNEMLNSMCDAMDEGKCYEMYEYAKERLENCDNDSTVAEHDGEIENVSGSNKRPSKACSFAIKSVMVGLFVEYVVIVSACLYLRYWGY